MKPGGKPGGHTYAEQIEVERMHNATLDGYFSTWYDIEPVGHSEQLAGIDRRFTAWSAPTHTRAVEYKSDLRAASTGNAFIETYSNVESGRPGWARTCSADVLVYYCVGGAGVAYLIRPDDIRAALPSWSQRYRSADCYNRDRGFHSRGLLVPLPALASVAFGCREIQKNPYSGPRGAR